MKEGEVPRVTKCIMRPTLEPEDEQTWIALENDAEDAWTVRRRLREKSAVRRMDVSMRPQPDEEEEEEKHKLQKERIQQILKEEAQHLIEDDPEIANERDQDHPQAQEDDAESLRPRRGSANEDHFPKWQEIGRNG